MSVSGAPQGGEGGRSGTRQLRNRLALTTILTVAPFFGYGRTATAACDPSPASPVFVCSGANVVTQAVTADNADVSTAPGFSVIAPAGKGITVTGDGHLRFTDQNDSIITGDEDGLSVIAAGDAGATPGAVTVTVNSTITGGFSGLRANNSGTGDLVVTADGKVTGQNVTGILAGVGPSGRNLTVNTGSQSDVTGYQFGIDARSSGTGDIIINANGKVTAIDGEGIFAFNDAFGRDLTITTGADSDVIGSRFGIRGRNDGTGDLTMTVNGDVTGTAREGVYALGNSTGNNLTVTIGAGSVVKGGYDGVEARNIGRGALNVNVYGDVTGAVEKGVWVVNYAGASATVTTSAQSKVTGYDGIGGRNDSGDFTITANGEVTGRDRHGIYARNTADANDLKITAGAESDIYGKNIGIYVRNFGRDIDITVHGDVTGATMDGIRAFNAYVSSPTPTGYGRDLKITTGDASYVRGRQNGIVAHNYGTGDLRIIADGTVIGEQGYGIRALNLLAGNGVEIVTGAGSKISGGMAGISARNNTGAGGLSITANGEVAGGNYGILAENRSASGDLKIVTGAASVVTGEYGIIAKDNKPSKIDITVGGIVQGTAHAGIRVQNNGGGDAVVEIEATGRVEGSDAGIIVSSVAGRSVIVNAGYITATNLMAIDALGDPVEITNSGVISGRVDLTDGDDRLDNLAGGVFAARSSDFGGGHDVVNNAGLLQAAHGIAEFENVSFWDLEAFNNSGTMSLVDGLANDQFSLGPAANYVGYGGRLAVDAFLAPGSDGKSDKLLISGSTGGTTILVVNLTNPIGSAPNTDGIRVVSVDGTSLAEDFRLESGVLNAGFFAWGLRRVQDGISVEHQLYTTGLGAGAHEFAAGITGAQDMWQQTTGTLLQRQADLRPLIAAQQVTPVADFVTPVEPTPVGRVTPGLWFKGVGG
ncbi:MAG: beta strand repeat-containing protein, partial [Pseudomonadota bacterium]